MPRPSQKDKVLQAALECFARRGYGGSRIRDIAERAGVSEAALYRHYKSKEEVARELYCHHLNWFSDQLRAIVDSEQSIEERLSGAVRLILTSYREHPAAVSFVLLNTSPFMSQMPLDTVYPMDLVEQLIASGQRENVIRRGQPNLLAAIFLGCVLRPIVMSQLADPGALDLIHNEQHDPVILAAALAAVTQSK